MKKFYKIGLFFSFLAMASLTFSSCATLFHGSLDDVSFSSDPNGAKVYSNGIYLGKTPLKMQLDGDKTYSIEFRKEGYESKTVLLNNSTGAGWIILDILGGLLPIIVDAATGDWNSLTQDNVNAALEKKDK